MTNIFPQNLFNRASRLQRKLLALLRGEWMTANSRHHFEPTVLILLHPKWMLGVSLIHGTEVNYLHWKPFILWKVTAPFHFVAAKVLEMSEEQRQHILSSQDFAYFFDKTTRLVEKAICENMDICFDYGGTGEDNEGWGSILYVMFILKRMSLENAESHIWILWLNG